MSTYSTILWTNVRRFQLSIAVDLISVVYLFISVRIRIRVRVYDVYNVHVRTYT